MRLLNAACDKCVIAAREHGDTIRLGDFRQLGNQFDFYL
jgi:hypothetical protein